MNPESKIVLDDVRLFTVPYFCVRSFHIPRLTVAGILIFKCTEGACGGDYSSGGKRGTGGARKILLSPLPSKNVQTAPTPEVVLSLMQRWQPVGP